MPVSSDRGSAKYITSNPDKLSASELAAEGKGVKRKPILKHKDSFGKSENLSKIFFREILEFDHDYEGISSSSNDLL